MTAVVLRRWIAGARRLGARSSDGAAPTGGIDREESRLATIIAVVAVGLQFSLLSAIATLVVSRFSLTMDMMYHAQPMHLIGRGDLDPVEFGGSSPYRYRYDHGAFLTWLFAPLTRVFPAAAVLQGVNTLAVTAGSWFMWLIIASEARKLQSPSRRWVLRSVGLALLCLDPWPYWANAFDYHPHVTAVAFVCGAVYFGYRRAPLPCVAMLVCVALLGDVASTYAAAIGIGLLFRREMRTAGAIGIGVAVAEFTLVAHMRPHDLALPRAGMFYAYLLDPAQQRDVANVEFGAVINAAIHHPARVVSELWLRRTNAWASLSPVGIVGIAHPLVATVAVIVVLESLLAGSALFSQPGHQLACAYPTIALGTTLFLAYALRRNPKFGLVAGLVLVVNVLGWATTFGPLLSSHWIRYGSLDAARLALVRSEIPDTNQVYVTQAAVGAFAERKEVFHDPATFLKYAVAKPTDVILTPFSGVNLESPDEIARQLSWWIFVQRAKVVSVDDDIWLLELPDGPRLRDDLPDFSRGAVPAWALRVGSGARVIADTPGESFVRAARGPGYAVSGAIDNLVPGAYRISVRESGTGAFVIEIYDRHSDRLFVQSLVKATRGVADVGLDVDIPDSSPTRASLDGGNAFYGFDPLDAHAGETQIEVRIFEPGRASLKIYSFETTRRS